MCETGYSAVPASEVQINDMAATGLMQSLALMALAANKLLSSQSIGF